ncbi:MAG TPA: hypothetical protein VI636_02200 [Candidatus Angelobacter sp.]
MSTKAKRTMFVAVLGASLLMIRYAVRGQTQEQPPGVPDRAFQLAEKELRVSKLDWILLTARVRVMEQALAHESSRPATLVGFHYDADRKRAVAKGFLNPEWFSGAKIDQLKSTLQSQGLSYCVDGFGMAEAEAGETLASGNMGKDCSVDFFTWTTDKTGKIVSKDVATFESGQIILK